MIARKPIATGNWGCGVFRGDPQLKSLLQWVAASKANCPQLLYYVYGDYRVQQVFYMYCILFTSTYALVYLLSFSVSITVLFNVDYGFVSS